MMYVIINQSEVSSVNFDQVVETSTETLRYSIDGTKTFVKFFGETPTFLEGKPQYTRGEIINTLNGPEWSEEL